MRVMVGDKGSILKDVFYEMETEFVVSYNTDGEIYLQADGVSSRDGVYKETLILLNKEEVSKLWDFFRKFR